MYETNMYEGMIAETVTMYGANGDVINAYMARPLGPGPFPAMVLAHHMPGWDEWYREATRKFAHHGYITISPDLYHRSGHGSPEDVAAKARAAGGIPDTQAVGDLAGAMHYVRAQSYCSGKVGAFGTCSGGRHVYLLACRTPSVDATSVDALVDCWGGGVVMAEADLTENRPVAPIEYTAELPCPLLGIFGEDDHSPTVDQVATHEEALKQHGKNYEFHMYPDAGHGFFYYNRPAYRQAQAVDGWEKIFAFLKKNLS